jgi:predicted Zn-dependent protease
MTANGIMQVWTGLLVRVSSEDELAAVLGHELAHYTQLHTLERLRRIKSSLAASSVIDLLLLGLPLAQMAAIANIMAFNREQEEEADLLGVSFMAQSGYDPHAAARVWQMIVEEEARAAAKSEAPGLFTNTHPAAEDRIVTLTSYVEENYPETTAKQNDHSSHLEILNRYYLFLMEDQIDTNRFGRTENILKRHQEIGVNPSLINFFYGEMYRQRKSEGDFELARQSYERAIQAEDPFADAYRNLGYVHLKLKQPAQAGVHFRKYLELKPDADDRAMIEFYLEE